MWREESGFLEMFLAYYSQFEENVSVGKAYRDFLFEVLCAHERSVCEAVPESAVAPELAALEAEGDRIEVGGLLADAAAEAHRRISLPGGPELRIKEECADGDFDCRVPFEENFGGANTKSEGGMEEALSFQLPGAANPDEGGMAAGGAPSLPGLALLAAPSAVLWAPLACTPCRQDFRSASELQRHQRMHAGERPYVCGVCGRRFTSSSHLRRHERQHTGERPHVCGVCAKAFVRKETLQAHERIHTRGNPFSCRFCGKRYRVHASLLLHERKHAA